MRAQDRPILNILRSYGHVFVIPPFQRNYEWTKAQCEELFNDILILYNNPQKRHFLGNIVYYLGHNQGAGFGEYILVDGQQRLTSILLMLCAIRDLIEDDRLKIEINNCYLRNDQNIAIHAPVRIKQTSYDRIVFENLIMCRELDDRDRDSNIYINYCFFRSLLVENNLNTSDSLQQLTQAMAQIDIVDVNLETGNDLAVVQTIFEKINSTGKPLSHADLIRNYLLLSNDLTEQERLYRDYWVPLENTLGSGNIKDFAKCYFTIKAKEAVNDTELYYAFKHFFNESGYSKESILREMKRLSNFYKWLNMECCPNSRINYLIQEFNALQAKDMYSLYINLFERLYENDVNCLLEVFGVLADFLVRFRIVGRGHGGAAIKTIVVELLNRIASEDFTISAEAIRYELSRNNGEKKYPDNDEFKQALISSRKYNHTYGRVVLRRIEDMNGQALNIPIPLTSMTIEHFMPQSRTIWWEHNLGGTENSNRVYNLYLNSIGNLGIMSGPLNSRISNRPWPEKRASIRNIQFNVTRVDCERWTEEEIRIRNDRLSEMAVKYITGPVCVDDIIIDGDSGEYPASDIRTNLTGANVISFKYRDILYNCDTWQTIWDFVVKTCYETNADRFQQIVQSNTIHKSTRIPGTDSYYPIIVRNEDDARNLLIRSRRIGDTDYYYEKNLSSERIRVYSNFLLSNFGLLENMSYIVKFPDLEQE